MVLYRNKRKVYKTKPNFHLGWIASDPARDRKQAFSLARSYPRDELALVVLTGKNRGKDKHIFPYTIYTKSLWKNERADKIKF